MKTPNQYQLQTHIDMMEHNIKLLLKLNDPAVNLIAGYIETDLNKLKRDCGVPVNLTAKDTQEFIEKSYNESNEKI